MYLPEKFARRVEEGSLVLWRPGFTIWITAWGNDQGESQANRLEWIKESASPNRFAEHQIETNNLTRFSYRLRDNTDDGPVESVYAFVINNDGHFELAIYFDNIADEERALQLVESVNARTE